MRITLLDWSRVLWNHQLQNEDSIYHVNATILCMHALEKNGNTIAKDLPAVSAAFPFDTPMYKFDMIFKVDRLEIQHT